MKNFFSLVIIFSQIFCFYIFFADSVFAANRISKYFLVDSCWASDTLITSEIKGTYLITEGFNSFDISVTTHCATTTLSGKVNTIEQRDFVEKIAKKINKNGTVINNIEISK